MHYFLVLYPTPTLDKSSKEERGRSVSPPSWMALERTDLYGLDCRQLVGEKKNANTSNNATSNSVSGSVSRDIHQATTKAFRPRQVAIHGGVAPFLAGKVRLARAPWEQVPESGRPVSGRSENRELSSPPNAPASASACCCCHVIRVDLSECEWTTSNRPIAPKSEKWATWAANRAARRRSMAAATAVSAPATPSNCAPPPWWPGRSWPARSAPAPWGRRPGATPTSSSPCPGTSTKSRSGLLKFWWVIFFCHGWEREKWFDFVISKAAAVVFVALTMFYTHAKITTLQ